MLYLFFLGFTFLTTLCSCAVIATAHEAGTSEDQKAQCKHNQKVQSQINKARVTDAGEVCRGPT